MPARLGARFFFREFFKKNIVTSIFQSVKYEICPISPNGANEISYAIDNNFPLLTFRILAGGGGGVRLVVFGRFSTGRLRPIYRTAPLLFLVPNYV